MNEGDSAGGQTGPSPAPHAVIDRRSNSSGPVLQMSSGSAVLISRMQSGERRNSQQNINNSQQQQQLNQQLSTNTRNLYQNQYQISANNNSNIQVTNSSYVSAASSNIKTESVVTSSSASENIKNPITYPLTTTTAASASSPAAAGGETTVIENLDTVSPSKKRIKLEEIITGDETISGLKKRILEHKYQRLKSLKEKYSEHVAEMYFLQTGGSMIDYPVWRKKAHTPQFMNFMKSYKLDPSFFEESTALTTQSNPSSSSSSSIITHGAEIKIPGVGVTPVAVSTQLPAAVAQLSQQGGTPLLLETSIVNTTAPDQKDSIAIQTVNTNGSNVATGSGTNSIGGVASSSSTGQEQFSAKAKQEVYVMQRVTELQKEGLWTERRLPKVQEPTRPKAHWDYLLEEMVWLATDFAQERKWKKSAAKKCARMVQKYFQDKALAAQRAEKAQELHLKRIASFVAKEIKVFWSNVEKLVEYKQHTKLEEKRKKALDQHLSFIVDQTEKFSQQLAEGMNKSVDVSAAPSLNSSRISSPKPRGASDDEFSPGNASSDDDEETIAKAEAEDDTEVSEEIAALQRESEMPLDDFLKELPKDYLEKRDTIEMSQSESEVSDDEFKADENSTDDENTIKKQEEKEKSEDHQKELEDLNADNDMSIEDLLAKYKDGPKTAEKMDVDEDSDDLSSQASDDDLNDDDDEESDENMDIDTPESMSEEENQEEFDLKKLLDDSGTNKDTSASSNKDDLINDAAAIAESLQPKGNTLSSTNVVTPIPFLLKHSLREYQHIGLDWLVTMHDRKLNGILADEMGLGKTIQTISLLAHLACMKGNWGPHLIIVPSSVMLNWEMEFKKWCPGFKILTYYGTQKERKLKRTGWTKPNTFHVCITSYKLVIQDHQSFRRKKWKYLILDEAQNIKNFKSQRWQLLLNFQTDQRLLLTGTPLQNNLMELWSLMHFLMPHVFQSHREFKEWFSNPMTGMIEGNSEYNESIIKRLHKVLRPFLLRRLKCEVEKQMPKKYEHVVMCRLSKRQRYLYDDFMSRAKTRETLESGNLLSVINVLMQLRKVCNHPNLFEVRPTISPFQMEGVQFSTSSLVCNILDYNPFEEINLEALNLVLLQLEKCMTAYVAYRVKKLMTPRKLIEEIDSAIEPAPQCPSRKLKLHIRLKDARVQDNMLTHSGVKVGTSPAMKTDGTKYVPISTNNLLATTESTTNKKFIVHQTSPSITLVQTTPTTTPHNSSNPPPLLTTQQHLNMRKRNDMGNRINVSTAGHLAQIVQTSSGRHILLTPTNSGTTVLTQSGQRLTVLKNVGQPNRTVQNLINKSTVMKVAVSTSQTPGSTTLSQPLAAAIVQQWKTGQTHVNNTTTIANTQDVQPKITETEFFVPEKEQQRKERRMYKLQMINSINHRRCEASPIYGSDLRDCLSTTMTNCDNFENSNWMCRSHVNCLKTMIKRDTNWCLSKMIKSYEERTKEFESIFSNFVIFVPAVSAPLIDIHVSHPHPSKVNQIDNFEKTILRKVSPKMALLHPIISAMCTQFPDPRLIQYDCGKLQTLDKLLRRLKCEGHKALIFTQMTRMLDVLEAFLNYHGYIYLRLDGTTKVEQRQILMERFNGDKRIFAFILSTRSGGVGVNLTGADTVIFYDSDWNPTMDAQAQDRCHRIGQTRDVHIYRLISEKTIEENILKKANQKRLLGDLAIEGGNFTTAYFKSTTIQDIFEIDQMEDDANARLSEIVEQSKDRRQRLTENMQTQLVPAPVTTAITSDERGAINMFESALAEAEDVQDVEAATTAKAEAAADLAEFDENIPIIEDLENKPPEMSKAEQEVENIMKQLSPIERYAMRFVEETGGSWTAEQLKLAEAEIELQKKEWEANRLAAIKKEEEDLKKAEEENELLTYSSEDAKNQIWISKNTMELMPMWCPPTPPQDDDTDVYRDYALAFLYDTVDTIPESQLPAVYIKKEYKRGRTETGFFMDGRRPLKIRKEDSYYPPRSLFDKPSPALAKIRRELKMQRYRGIFKPSITIPGLKQTIPVKPLIEPEGMAEWFIYEDMSILNVIQNLQGLPLNLMLLSPGHTPNWDLVSDIVNQSSRTYRSLKQCRYRYEAVVVPREEGKLVESPKKQKKNKNPLKLSSSSLKGGVRSMKTSQCYLSDNNNAFTKFAKLKFDNIKTAFLKKAPQLKQVLVNPSLRNPKHAAVLSEFGIVNYEIPITPLELAVRRAERLSKDKQKNPLLPMLETQVTTSPQQQQQIQSVQVHQQQTTPQQQQQQTTAIVVHPGQAGSTPLLVQTASPIQVARSSTAITPQQSQQIVKAIVASSSGNIQHIAVSQANQIQLATSQVQGHPSTVSVVLTTPVTSLSSLQQSASQPQIVSIHTPNLIGANNTMVTQSGGLVQTVTTQSLPQVVSVSQLANVGTVISTLPSNVATFSSSLRAQRIVAPGGLQEVVLNQRGGAQPQNVVLGQSLTQAQLQNAQLRLQMSTGQQVSGVVAKGIQAVQTTVGKPATTSQFQFYRHQTLRQQFKVLHTNPGQAGGTVVQTAGGQATLVSPGTIIQGGIMQQGNNIQTVQVQQASTGQKVQLVSTANTVSVSSPIVGQTGVVGTIATVQVNPGQGRPQFIKHVGNKQTITRQVNESDVQALMIKRQIINQQQKTHLGPPIQFAPANVQVQQQQQQQAGTSGQQQQIATLVKTSSGLTAAALQQVKPGQIKATMANQTQVRQIQLQQQQIAIAQQQRKSGKMTATQFAQVAGKSGMPTQLIVQNPKSIPGTVTVQQIQQVIRHAQPGTIATGQIVLGKPGRVIPVSVASQPNQRQTIQVVTATSAAQALAAGNLRTHSVVTSQNLTGAIQGTIKVSAAGQNQQQAILTAFQNQQQQRQNQSPVRLQTTSGGSLVAVTMQQQPQPQQQQQTIIQQSNMLGGVDASGSNVQQQQHQGQNSTLNQQNPK